MTATTNEAATAPTPAPRLRAGWRVIARKEFADHLLSVRFIILVLLMGLTAIVAVYAAGGEIRSVAEGADEVPALFLKLFTVSPDRIPAFFSLVGLLGPLLGIVFAFDAINGERTQGTLPRLVAQPIYRDDIVNGKFLAGISVIGLIVVTVTAIVGGVGLFRIGIVPTGAEVIRVMLWLLVTIVYIGFWLALATLFSVWLRRASTSALAAISAWLVSTLFAGLIVGIVVDAVAPVPESPAVEEVVSNAKWEQNLSRIFPGTLYEEATLVLLRPEIQTLGIIFQDPGDRSLPSELSVDQSLLIVWPQLAALVALTVLCFAGAYVLFMRQEIRA